MELMKKTGFRRFSIVVNYLALLGLLVIFQIGKSTEWNNLLRAGEVITFLIVAVTFIMIHVKTNLWNLLHTSAEELDEREMQLTNWSLRYAYSIFTVIVLLLFMINATYEPGTKIIQSMGMMFVITLIYLAHSLPASVISWRKSERE